MGMGVCHYFFPLPCVLLGIHNPSKAVSLPPALTISWSARDISGPLPLLPPSKLFNSSFSPLLNSASPCPTLTRRGFYHITTGMTCENPDLDKTATHSRPLKQPRLRNDITIRVPASFVTCDIITSSSRQPALLSLLY